jgi:hypothetical protein
LRFISSYRGLELGLRNPKITGFTQTGDPIYDGSYLKAEFIQGGVDEREAQEAFKSLIFKGMYESEDPRERLSWFDTELAQMHYKWTDEEREYAEGRLQELEGFGRDYILVQPEAIPAPWASYDTTDVKLIVDLMQATGTNAGDVLAYERSNKNRQAVIDAVEAAGNDAPQKSAEVVVNA